MSPLATQPSSPIPTTYATDSTPQQTFASNYDLDNHPQEAMTSYARLIHQRTKRQMDFVVAQRSATDQDSDGERSSGSERERQ
ncbi:hypothetical protein MMC28_006601 [Mycoblastus sanguinarius]|nr:hypothetical protein [Mycoblastus sanguinarius]